MVAGPVVILAGGTGGAKLAAGLHDLLGEGLTVVANTGDDIEVHGVHVSPDPDLITYWLAGEIDAERGWGIRGDTFHAFERLTALGSEDWFGLSDRDLAACLRRTRLLREGGRLTDAQAEIASALGVRARVLPMSDDPVRTDVLTPAGWRTFQEYLIQDRCEPPVSELRFTGIDDAHATAEVEEAVANADLIVIGPSNPVCSIGPILALPGMRDRIASAAAPVVAVSPFVAGHAVKGPTERFMQTAGHAPSATGVADAYRGLLDLLVVDNGDPEPPPDTVATASMPTLMDTAEARRSVARLVLEAAPGPDG